MRLGEARTEFGPGVGGEPGLASPTLLGQSGDSAWPQSWGFQSVVAAPLPAVPRELPGGVTAHKYRHEGVYGVSKARRPERDPEPHAPAPAPSGRGRLCHPHAHGLTPPQGGLQESHRGGLSRQPPPLPAAGIWSEASWHFSQEMC